MVNTLFLWTTIIIIALLIEVGTPGLFYFLSLAVGSASAAFVAYYDYDIATQLGSCFIISCLTLLILRYVIAHNAPKDLHTNMQAFIGQKTRVIEPIRADKAGTVKIYGDIWLAREEHNADVEEGHEVTIVDVQGCHLIVKK